MTQSVTVSDEHLVVDTTNIEATIDTEPVAIHVMTWDDGLVTAQLFAVHDGEWGEPLLLAREV